MLEQVDVIAAEDTRTSGVLLKHFGIASKLTSYHDFNKERVTAGLLDRLRAGECIAVITDAGTPGISDPAFYIVREAIKKNIQIEAIPGATAFVPAVILSGLPTDRFVFEGFLPPKKGRKTRLELLMNDPRTLIFYESPKRVLRTLNDIYQYFGDRQIAIAREITKKFEQVVRGSLSEILADDNSFPKKGEFVLVVHGKEKQKQKQKKYRGKSEIEY